MRSMRQSAGWNSSLFLAGSRVAGTRELVITTTRYIVAYRIQKETVQVLAVMHGAQRWPRRFGGK